MTDIEETPASDAPAVEPSVEPVAEPVAEIVAAAAPEAPAEASAEPTAPEPVIVEPEPTPVEEAAAAVVDDATTFPALLIWKNREGQWQVDARHASGQETSSSWAQLQHAFHNAEAWVRAHI